MKEPPNVNVETVRNRLEERLSLGRLPPEAAGELRWMMALQHDHGLLSNQTLDEAYQVIDEWLKEEMGTEASAAVLLAKSYADFLARRVSIAPTDDPSRGINEGVG